MLDYFWTCPLCNWHWTIHEGQLRFFDAAPVWCLNCEKYKLTVEEVKKCPSQEAANWTDDNILSDREKFLLEIVKSWWDCTSDNDQWECIHADKEIHTKFESFYNRNQEDQVSKDVRLLFARLLEKP